MAASSSQIDDIGIIFMREKERDKHPTGSVMIKI